MNYVLTDHARKRCTRRRTEEAWVSSALDHPARIESDPDDNTLAHALRPVPAPGFQVSHAIYDGAVAPVAVVPAYFDDEVTDPMKLKFDPMADAYFEIISTEITTPKEIQPGIIADYDADVHIVGIDVLSVSKRGLPVAVGQAA